MASRNLKVLGTKNENNFVGRVTRRKSNIMNDENVTKNVGKEPSAFRFRNKTNITENAKRKTDVKLEKASKKRYAFGDLTNALEKTLQGKKDTQKTTLKSTASTSSFRGFVNRGTKTTLKPKVTAQKKRNLPKKQESGEDAIFFDPLSTEKVITSPGDSLVYVTASEGSPIIDKSKQEAKPKSPVKVFPEGVEDFDADQEDIFSVSPYAYDIFEYYKEREKKFVIEKYLARQPYITRSMRAILVDWMVEVQESFELNHETLYLAVKIVDLYSSKVKIRKDELQLVGSTSLFIACKFDERTPPYADDFLFICDNAYKKEQLFSMEIKVLKTIGYDLGVPLSYRYLRRYARVASVSMEDLTFARYILERTLLDYDFIDVSDSILAAAVLFLSRIIKKNPTWTPTLEYYSGYKVEDLYHVVQMLHSMLLDTEYNEKYKTIFVKYCHKVFFEVAKTPIPEEISLGHIG